MENDAVRIIITGGTFDKHYDAIKGTLTFKQTHLPEILEQSRVTVPVALTVSRLIDSLDMGPGDREQILQECRSAPESRIIITHGTDTMENTAALLGDAALEKTIVLTGAMVPFAMAGSDAVFNLGGAMTAVQLLPPGVYIAMNSRIFPWDRVHKNRGEGLFEGDPWAPGAAGRAEPD